MPWAGVRYINIHFSNKQSLYMVIPEEQRGTRRDQTVTSLWDADPTQPRRYRRAEVNNSSGWASND